MIPGEHVTTTSQQRPGWRWALGIGLPFIGALSWAIWALVTAAWGPLAGIVPALTCLAAGWVLRSWVGLIVAAVVYVGAGAIMWVLAGGGGLNVEYVLAIALPGVVLAALGTVLGMYRAR